MTTTLDASAGHARSTTTSARINPDTRSALVLAMFAVSGLVSVSFVLSYAGLSALAPWAAVPGHLAPLIPLFIDGAILVYTYSALAARARRESAVRPWTWVALWTAVSASANAAHAWSAGPQAWEGVVGAVLAALFPIGSLLGCHEIADRMIARPARTPDTDTGRTPANAVKVGAATDGSAQEGAAPVAPVVERSPEPTVPDTGHRARTAPGRPRGRVAEHRERIVHLARTTDMSGRAIADELGLGRTSVCALVSEVRGGLVRSPR